MSYRYIVITPARNEAEYLPETIRSMVSQTIKPLQWIIVNDGSSDETGTIVDEASAKYSWISGLHIDANSKREARGDRAIEAKEIVAFHKGLDFVESTSAWEFVVKLDADVGFSPDYFARCLAEFTADPLLGIGGGTIINKTDTGLEREPHPVFHVRGATKIYRRRCWDAMGGISTRAGWDTMDEVKANQLSWKTRTFSDIEILHFRPTGAANGAWKNGIKNGIWSYQIGYHPVYMLLRSGKQLFHRPYLTGAAALLAGYCKAAIDRAEHPDGDLARYVWQQQWNRITGRPSIWR